jgi:5-enolpyruvylshikimate-3-phosphate synthase
VARKNSMELSQVSLHLEIHDKASSPNLVCSINGLYLEGAQLNLSSMTLEEPSITSSEELYIEFPSISIIATLTEKKSIHQKVQEKRVKQEMDRLITKAKELELHQFYKCPIYKNELRLQEKEGMRFDVEPLTFIDIRSGS